MKVLVMGDFMLDIFSYYSSVRISPECNVPILNLINKNYYLGGAANVAVNISDLLKDEKVFFASLVGKNSEFNILNLFKKFNISMDYLFYNKSLNSITKERVISNGNHHSRIDNDVIFLEKDLIKLIEKIKTINTINFDLIIYSDYNKYLFNKSHSSKIINLFQAKYKIANIKPENINLFQNMDVIIVNTKEASDIFGKNLLHFHDFALAAKFIKLKSNCKNVIITRSAEGSILLDENNVSNIFDAVKSEVKDVAGAGDVFTAVFSYNYADGKSLEESIKLAHKICAEAVSKPGTCRVYS